MWEKRTLGGKPKEKKGEALRGGGKALGGKGEK